MTIPTPLFDAERLTRVNRVTEAMPSPDGTWLAVAVSRLDQEEGSYISDLWRVSLTEPQAPPLQLTRGTSNDTRPRFRPDGALAFLSDRKPMDQTGASSGSDAKRTQVWAFPKLGGEPEQLTDEPLGVLDYKFAQDTGQLFLIAQVFLGIPHPQQRAHAEDLAKHGPSGLHYTSLPVRHWDHWVEVRAPHVITFDPDSGERIDLTPDADREHREFGFDVEWDVSPDGRFVVITSARPGAARIQDVALRLIDVDTGEYRDLGEAAHTQFSIPRFSPDGERIACVRLLHVQGRSEEQDLWLFDELDGSDPGRALAGDWDVWPELVEWTPDGEDLLVLAAHRGQVPVFRVHVDTGAVTRITAEEHSGSHCSVHATRDGERLVGLRHRLIHPPEPFWMPLEDNEQPQQLANLSGFLPLHGEAVATWESFTVTSDDGAPVHSFLLRPRGQTAPHPTLVWVHGGPQSMYADGWHWRWNPLIPVAAGYAVVLPNPRGSIGFGQAFVQGIWNNEWGGACYRDLMAVTDAVCERADIDATRIGAMGGSFGGYMANWIGVSTDRFRCLMTHAGIFSMSAFAGTTDYPAYFHYEMNANPYLQPEAYNRYSPHHQIANWKTPTLIIHGEKDYRVPISEALLLFEALDWRGVDVELLVFPDENHWIAKPQNIRLWYRKVLEFADKHLSAP